MSEEDFLGSTILQEVDVSAVPHRKCNRAYDGEIVKEIMFCAGKCDRVSIVLPRLCQDCLTQNVLLNDRNSGDEDGGKDSCQGDSGGPIVDQDGTQVGVVSWVRMTKMDPRHGSCSSGLFPISSRVLLTTMVCSILLALSSPFYYY